MFVYKILLLLILNSCSPIIKTHGYTIENTSDFPEFISEIASNEKVSKQKILDSLDSSRVKLMMQSGHPTSELIKIANYLSMGNIEMSNNNYSNAINLYKKA